MQINWQLQHFIPQTGMMWFVAPFLDRWEEGDDALKKHQRCSPSCGVR